MSKRKEGKFYKDFEKKSKRSFSKKTGGKKFEKSTEELKSGSRFKKDYDKDDRKSDDKRSGGRFEKRDDRKSDDKRSGGRFEKRDDRKSDDKRSGGRFEKRDDRRSDDKRSGGRFEKRDDRKSDDKRSGGRFEKRDDRNSSNNRRGAGRFERSNDRNSDNRRNDNRFEKQADSSSEDGREERSYKRDFEAPNSVNENEKSVENPENKDTVRLNKYVASAGIASRRKADELIRKGFVKVNDEVVLEMGFRVKDTDVIKFKNEVIKPEQRKVYFLLNKPKNVITTTDDEKGRRHVMDIMGNVCEERIYPVGRLDRDTTGLLLFTNDGDLAKKLSHPSYEIKKIYHVTLDKPISPEELEQIRVGLILEDGETPVDKVEYDSSDPSGKSVVITVHIGRNRIVRRIFAHLGYTVLRLDRIYYGGLTKKNIGRGFHRPLKKQEIIMLKHFI
jgi:23S rRNA pseudouridine2605 synthase